MRHWLKAYQKSTPQTKYFIATALIFGLALVLTTLYCYGRLDYVRSYKIPPKIDEKHA